MQLRAIKPAMVFISQAITDMGLSRIYPLSASFCPGFSGFFLRPCAPLPQFGGRERVNAGHLLFSVVRFWIRSRGGLGACGETKDWASGDPVLRRWAGEREFFNPRRIAPPSVAGRHPEHRRVWYFLGRAACRAGLGGAQHAPLMAQPQSGSRWP